MFAGLSIHVVAPGTMIIDHNGFRETVTDTTAVRLGGDIYVTPAQWEAIKREVPPLDLNKKPERQA